MNLSFTGESRSGRSMSGFSGVISWSTAVSSRVAATGEV